MENEISRKNAGRTRGRPFQPGNPGRPKGARNKATRAAEALTRRAIDLALEGDVTALRLCLDRILPVRKGRPVTIDLPPARAAADVVSALAALVEAVARGQLTPEEGQAMAGLLEAQRRAIETGEVEQRLSALEMRMGAGR